MWGGDIASFQTINKEKEECYDACKRHPECTVSVILVSHLVLDKFTEFHVSYSQIYAAMSSVSL